MANIESYTRHQQQVKKQNGANPSKYYTNFLYKALTVIIFLVIIPILPSQAPEFINQNLLNRSWELLHILLVGIAISYGIFSRRNDETEKEHNTNNRSSSSNNSNNNNQSKFDNVQSLVSNFLQVSSVFDDEAEHVSGFDHETKVQTWSNQYYRNEPPVTVAKEQAIVDENTSSASHGNPERPLLLPVRRLKSRVLNEKNNGELRGSDHENKVVLPSPIPWRSRSGRMEMEEDIETRSFRSPSARFSLSNSMASSPKKSSYTRSLSMETQAKSTEDLVRKKGILRSPSPPPPSSLKRVNYGKAVRFDQTKPTFMEFPREEKRGIVEKLVVETDDDDDSESDGEEINETRTVERRPNNEEANAISFVNDGGSDVDKKADEFIAKVREQIRLQRIDSIKRNFTR